MKRFTYTAGEVTLVGYDFDYADGETAIRQDVPAYIIRDRAKVIGWSADRDDAERIVQALEWQESTR